MPKTYEVVVYDDDGKGVTSAITEYDRDDNGAQTYAGRSWLDADDTAKVLAVLTSPDQRDQSMWQVIQVLNLLRVSTEQFTGAMHRFEDRAKEERNDIARVLDLARRIDIRLGVALGDRHSGETITVGLADAICVSNEAGEGVNFGFPPGRYRVGVLRPSEAILIERDGSPSTK